jgi:ADP-ribose pyrophosphatase YjhB (NUDIX family)
MDPHNVPEEILTLANALPRFPDGRIDYTHAPVAPVLNVFVLYQGKLLLVKRGDKVGWLKDRWHIIAGFLDEEKTLAEKALEEMGEELGITPESVKEIVALDPYRDPLGGKEWIIYPVIIDLVEMPEITLDWENVDYAWIELGDIEKYDVIPNVLRVAKTL